MNVDIQVKKVNSDAIIPKYQKEGDAGFDFHAVRDIHLKGHDRRIVPTGLKVAIPKGYEIEIVPRSGISLKTNLMIANSPGTIDSGYRGEIGIIVYNTDDYSTTIPKGYRIAQGKLKEVPHANFEEVDELPDSERGEGGFGSTGENKREDW